jgi:hypothetical protein
VSPRSASAGPPGARAEGWEVRISPRARACTSSEDAQSAQSGNAFRGRTQVNVAERAAPDLTTEAVLVTHAEL